MHVWVDSKDPNAKHERIMIEKVRERMKSPVFPGYWVWKETVKDVRTPRPQEDLDKIAEDRKALEVAA